MKFTRRAVLGMMGMTIAAAGLGCGPSGKAKAGRKTMVLGFDGMDYNLAFKMMEGGQLPNFKKVAEGGAFLPLVSSNPPQSPVAWSNFITGKNPGGHGIFDFIARDPKTYMPSFSLSSVGESEKVVHLFGLAIPLSSGKVELLRKGKAWWQILEEHGIPSTVLHVPSNFPPAATRQRTLSGMGTPDILGTYGTFSFYTSEKEGPGKVQGGKVYHVEVEDGVVRGDIMGPKNTLAEGRPDVTVPFKVYLDPVMPLAKVALRGHEIILKQGEWSGWLDVDFPLTAMSGIKGMVRLYLKSVRPYFRLYVSPVNIDPKDPSVPISTPPGYSREVAMAIGPYYTQGIPEETWALNEGRLDEDEFLVQAGLVKSERVAELKLGMEGFMRSGQGVYFCYFGLTDTGSHMFWRHRDPEHPMHDPKLSPRYAGAVEGFYREMDKVVGYALETLPGDATLMIMSDHGFAPFRRAFHLNRWLHENGYMALLDKEKDESGEFFENVDWPNTMAYAIGLNGLYINLSGREGQGAVSPSGKDALVAELIGKLGKVKDPKNGELVISQAYDAAKIYSGGYVHLAPDIVVGYNSGYRGSWETALGRMPKEVMTDNMKRWSGDHCMDPSFLPGIFLCNTPVKRGSVNIEDIAPTILALYGIGTPGDMDGKPLF